MFLFYFILKLFVILHVSNYFVCAQVQATNRRFNVTSPSPESVYVAGQIVPVTYTLPDDASLSSVLALAVYFTTKDTTLPFVQATISENADLSQGFSFRRTANTQVYYEHQLNYGIPKETKAGNYQIVFVDTKGGGNTSIPIVVRPYSATVASATNTNKAQPSNIFLQDNSGSILSFYGPLSALSLLSLAFNL